MLVKLFNEFGANDSYGQGFPSRWSYAEERLRAINGTPALAALICEVLDPRGFMDSAFSIHVALKYINDRLHYDGFEIVIDGELPKIHTLHGSTVKFEHPFKGSGKEAHLFIDEQIKKASDKIRDGDYDGAITNARSLLEGCLTEIESQLFVTPAEYDGDLSKLYKRVQKELGLDPARQDLDTPLKQVLTGLSSVVAGIAGLSNKMGDRHVRKYKPAKRHALLTVNAAKTVASYFFETFQERKGKSSN